MSAPAMVPSDERLLFDLSEIDLEATVADEAALEAILPQKGAMRQLDRVIWWDHSVGLGCKFVRDDEFWVPGHIPGRPLLPGVLQIEASAQLCCFVHRSRWPDAPFLGFTRVKQFSFRGQIVPGDTLMILSKQVKSNKRRFVSELQGFVGDKLVFDGSITGMQI